MRKTEAISIAYDLTILEQHLDTTIQLCTTHRIALAETSKLVDALGAVRRLRATFVSEGNK